MQELFKQLGISPKKKGEYEQAFIHRSFTHENRVESKGDNERLEYLGDAVLELIASEFLFDKFPLSGEGELTSLRAALVRKENLAQVAKKLHFGKYLKLSHGEESSGGREKDYLLANTLESFLGALYRDLGVSACRTFVEKNILAEIGNILEKSLHIDAKSSFQELTQETVKITPHYKILEQSGPDHDRTFIVGAYLGEKQVSKGIGASKRKAEEDAAKKALVKLKKLHKPVKKA